MEGIVCCVCKCRSCWLKGCVTSHIMCFVGRCGYASRNPRPTCVQQGLADWSQMMSLHCAQDTRLMWYRSSSVGSNLTHSSQRVQRSQEWRRLQVMPTVQRVSVWVHIFEILLYGQRNMLAAVICVSGENKVFGRQMWGERGIFRVDSCLNNNAQPVIYHHYIELFDKLIHLNSLLSTGQISRTTSNGTIYLQRCPLPVRCLLCRLSHSPHRSSLSIWS